MYHNATHLAIYMQQHHFMVFHKLILYASYKDQTTQSSSAIKKMITTNYNLIITRNNPGVYVFLF